MEPVFWITHPVICPCPWSFPSGSNPPNSCLGSWGAGLPFHQSAWPQTLKGTMAWVLEPHLPLSQSLVWLFLQPYSPCPGTWNGATALPACLREPVPHDRGSQLTGQERQLRKSEKKMTLNTSDIKGILTNRTEVSQPWKGVRSPAWQVPRASAWGCV